MSNWAKHIEDITGLPVFKRAKHGIHFQRPDGQIEAVLSVKPCHFLDGSIWKPIDTALIKLSDGFYGCPHSDVRIHPDGRVKVERANYQQRAELPSAKTGKADNDKLIREFDFGSQELRITEDGFRSEIVLTRVPTQAEVKKLIASESGGLPGKYRKSTTTAKDSSTDSQYGNTHVVTTLAAFRTWLASAVYPVIIDPDITLQPDAAAGMDATIVWHASQSYPTRNYGVCATAEIGAYLTTYVSRLLIKLDLSSVPESFTSAVFSLYCTNDYSTNARAFKIFRTKRAWVEGSRSDAIDVPATGVTWNRYDTTNNWSTAGGFHADDCEQTEIASRSFTASETVNEFKNWTFTPTTKTDLDLGNGWLIKADTESSDRYNFVSSDGATAGQRPKLVVTYTAGGGFTLST